MKTKKIALYSLLVLGTISFIGFHSKPITGNSESKSLRFPSGLLPDPFELYQSLPTYLSPPDTKLPKLFGFESAFPPPGDQGNQKSSVGFAVSFGLVSYFEATKLKKTNISKVHPLSVEGQNLFYSPSYVYTQLNGGRDFGASLLEAMLLVESRGSVVLNEMNYSPSNFRTKPGATQIEIGRKVRFSKISKIDPSDIASIKFAVTQKIPVVVSFLTYENFLEAKDSSVYESYSGDILGAQSLIVLGYDDTKKAFRVWNSWGVEWGDKGYLWISYPLFQKLTRSAYIASPSENLNLNSEKQILDALSMIPMDGDEMNPPKEVFVSKGEFRDRIRLIWSRVDKAIGYEIYRKRKGDTKYQLVGLTRQPAFEDLGIQKNLAYTYRISSVDEDKISPPSPDSNDGYASDDVKITEILPVTNLKTNLGKFSDRIVIEWDYHLTADQYSIYKWNSSSKIFRFLGKTEKPIFTDYKATKNGDSEIYRVYPHRKNLTGDGSTYVEGYLDPSKQLKPKPEKLYASKGEYTQKIDLSWEGFPNAIEYIIFRRPSNDDEWKKVAQTKNSSYTDINLINSEYTYAVCAVYIGQTYSLPSTIDIGFISLVAKRSDLSVSETPKILNLSVLPNRQELLLSWQKSTNIEKYTISIRKRQDKDWKAVVTLDGQKSEYAVSGLDKNQFYFLSIKAKESNKEESNFSLPVTGVLSETIADTKKTRTFGESAITRFLGPWTAMYWDGKSSVKPVKLEIKSDDANGFILQWNNKEFFRGNYVIDNHLLEEKGKWKIQLSPSLESLSTDLYENKLLPEKCHLSFVRE